MIPLLIKDFKISYQGPRQIRVFPHLPFIIRKKSIFTQSIYQELQNSRIAGPFIKPPFSNIQVSPIGIVPKTITRGKPFNILLVLSKRGFYYIHHVSQEFCTEQCQSVYRAMDIIKQLRRGDFFKLK